MSAPPLRVCFVNFFAYPLFVPAAGTSGGGAELQLYTMATELARDPGFAVSFVVRDGAPPAVEVREGVTIHPIPASGRGPSLAGALRHALALWRRLDAIDPQVIVQRAAGPLTGLLGLSCALRCRAFVYMVAHDSDLGGPGPAAHGPGQGGRAGRAVYGLGLRLATRIVVQHAGQAALLRARFGREGTVRPCVQRLPGPPAPPRDRFVLWVARGERWKRPERFIELAAAFPGERFVMVCPPAAGDPGVSRRVREQAAPLANLEVRGHVPHPELEGLFARALLFVNTSRSEGFPNTFVQAWKHGTPVLSLAVDPDGAIAAHGLGAVCGDDPSRLRAGLAALLEDPARWEACSRRARAWAREHHDARAQAERDKELLRAAWAERSGR